MYTWTVLCVYLCSLKRCLWQEDLSAWLMLSLKLAPGTNPPFCRPRPMCTVCVCVHTIHCTFRRAEGGCWAGGADGTGGLWAEEKKGVCIGGNNRWTCSRGYGVSLITHRPHLLICSNYLPTHWAPCQRWGVNTTDQIHLKIRVPTHSATPTQAFYGSLTTLNDFVVEMGLHVFSFIWEWGIKCEKIREWESNIKRNKKRKE